MTRAFRGAMLLIALVAGACGSSGPAGTAASSAAAAGLPGTWITDVSLADTAAAGIAEHERCENAGTFRRVFLADGHFTLEQTPAEGCGKLIAPSDAGTWSLNGKRLTFDEAEAFGCPNHYVYEITLSADTLALKPVEDNCPERVAVMTAHAWRRLP